MKSFTDIEQSKKLAEILPVESADMCWTPFDEEWDAYLGAPNPDAIKKEIPCWSLSALLNVLPQKYYPIKEHETNLILGKPKDKWCVLYWDTTGTQDGEQTSGSNPVDACVEMILKLNEQELL